MKKLKSIVDKVIVGDAMEQLQTMPDDIIDITVTSPPYNKRKKSYGWLVSNEEYKDYNDHMDEREYQTWQINVLNEVYRLTKPGGSAFYNHKIRWVNGKLLHPISWVSQTDWVLRQEIVWDRVLTANMRGWRFWQVDERIYWLYKPIDNKLVGKELESKHAKMSSIWRLRPASRIEEHPAPFPLEIPVRAIYSMVGDQKKLVLDPFCGTGTTLVAAKLLGHHYIGIDLSPEYVSYSQQRVLNAESEREQAEEEISKHIVDDPFAARKKRGTVNWPYGPKPPSENGDKSSDK